MKRILSVISVLTAVLILFVSCGGGGGEIVLNPDDTEERSHGSNDVFSFSGGTNISLAPHDNLEGFIKAAGEPLSYEESNSCAYLGLDKVWTYSGYTIYSYPVNGVDYLLQLVFTDDSVKTSEGISIGATEAEVRAAYGDGFETVGNAICYTRGNTVLQFGLKDGRVTSIVYNAA
ncbi:MAG: hypothetical protein ILP01_03285 [Clostridia bacterium]|nr:hypothetical protein [Clostridia bacterium]